MSKHIDIENDFLIRANQNLSVVTAISDRRLQDIMSSPTEKAQRLSQMIVPTLDARNVGREMIPFERDFLINESGSRELMEKHFQYFKMAEQVGNHLISLLPNCPVTKREAIMDRLLVLADKRYKLLGDLTEVKSDDLTNDEINAVSRIHSAFSRIHKIRSEAMYVMDDKKLLEVISYLSQNGNIDIISPIILHYATKRRILSNISSEINATYKNCMSDCSRISEINPDGLDEYIAATDALKGPLEEHKVSEEEASKYYKSI